jgi:putative cardiolipin synthase
VVPQLGVLFDRYWNSEQSYPATYFAPRADTGVSPQARLAQMLPRGTSVQLNLPETDLLGREPVGKELDANRLSLVPGVAYAVADRPSKLLDAPEQMENSALMAGAMSQMLGASTELVVTSPYLVPGKRGMAVMESLARKDVRMTVVTNSLRANDSVFVYFGYARYRPREHGTGRRHRQPRAGHAGAAHRRGDEGRGLPRASRQRRGPAAMGTPRRRRRAARSGARRIAPQRAAAAAAGSAGA